MLDRRVRSTPLIVVSIASTLVLAACGGDKETPTASKPVPARKAPLDDAKEPTKVDPEAPEPAEEAAGDGVAEDGDPSGAEDGADEAGGEEGEGAEEAAGEDGAGEDDAGEDDAGEDDAGEDDAGEDDAGEDGADAAEDGGESEGKDSAALIKEARTTKTTDERALEALAEAETAGATVKELARAAKARGDYLYKDPDRAKVFYEYSADKDEDYADPVFALAKQKAVTGDVGDVVKLLKQVSERKGGKKLLEQIDFDPTWDIVKDDPEVRALL